MLASKHKCNSVKETQVRREGNGESEKASNSGKKDISGRRDSMCTDERYQYDSTKWHLK